MCVPISMLNVGKSIKNQYVGLRRHCYCCGWMLWFLSQLLLQMFFCWSIIVITTPLNRRDSVDAVKAALGGILTVSVRRLAEMVWTNLDGFAWSQSGIVELATRGRAGSADFSWCSCIWGRAPVWQRSVSLDCGSVRQLFLWSCVAFGFRWERSIQFKSAFFKTLL